MKNNWWLYLIGGFILYKFITSNPFNDPNAVILVGGHPTGSGGVVATPGTSEPLHHGWIEGTVPTGSGGVFASE